MILFTIIMICLLSSLLRPRPYFGFYGPRFYHHRPGGFMRGPRGPMHHHHMGGPRRF